MPDQDPQSEVRAAKSIRRAAWASIFARTICRQRRLRTGSGARAWAANRSAWA